MSDNGRAGMAHEGQPQTLPPQVIELMLQRELQFLRICVGDVVLQWVFREKIQKDVANGQCRACALRPGQLCRHHESLLAEWNQRWEKAIMRCVQATDGRDTKEILDWIKESAEIGKTVQAALQQFSQEQAIPVPDVLPPQVSAALQQAEQSPSNIPQAVLVLRADDRAAPTALRAYAHHGIEFATMDRDTADALLADADAMERYWETYSRPDGDGAL